MHSLKIGKGSLYLLVVFVILALPLYGTNNIGRALTMPSYYLFSLVGVLCLIENGVLKRKWSQMGVLLGLYYLTIFWGIFLGFTKRTAELAYILWYFGPPLVVFMVNIVAKKKTLHDWLDLTYYAMFVSALLTFVMIQTRESSIWEFTSYLNGKLGGSYESIFLLTVPYGLYLLTSGKKRINRIIIILGTVLSVYDVIYAQSRSLLVFLLVELFAVIAIPNITKSSFGKKNKKILSRLITLLLVGLFIYGFINGESDLLFRMQTTNVLSSQDTLVGRWFTFLNNLTLAFKNPLGLGIGHSMHYYLTQGLVTIDRVYIDNSIVTCAVQCGLLSAIIVFLIILRTIVTLIKQSKKKTDSIWSLLLLCFGMILVNCTILSSQSIHEIGVSIAFWLLIGVVEVYGNRQQAQQTPREKSKC